MLVKRYYIFFFKQKTAYEMRISDWSSDVCSSDLERRAHAEVLDQWHSLVDIAEIAASAGVRVSVVQASSRQDHLVRNGIEYHFVDVAGSRDRSEEHTSELQSLMRISYAVFCLKKKKRR